MPTPRATPRPKVTSLYCTIPFLFHSSQKGAAPLLPHHPPPPNKSPTVVGTLDVANNPLGTLGDYVSGICTANVPTLAAATPFPAPSFTWFASTFTVYVPFAAALHTPPTGPGA